MSDHNAGSGRLRGALGDLRIAVRRLAATPLFTIFAVLSLGVGVGVTTAVYSSVDAALWKNAVIPGEESLAVVLGAETGQYNPQRAMSVPDLEDVRASQSALETVAAAEPVFPSIDTPQITVLTSADAVDASYFSTLGVSTALGRAIQAGDVDSRAQVAVLGYWLWRGRFNADPSLIGRTVRIGGLPFEVVGVAPEGFQGVVPGPRGAQLWIPITLAERFALQSRSSVTSRDRRRLTVFGRLRPGVDLSTASAELARIADRLDAVYPRPQRAGTGGPPRRGWYVKNLADLDRERAMLVRAGLVIIGLVALILVVACTNLSNLMLARGAVRRHEVAVRRALGASRWRLVREQLAETTLIAALGGVAAFIVLRLMMHVLNLEVPTGPSTVVSIQPRVNMAALLAAAGALLLALVVFGLEPALRLTRQTDVRGQLASGSGGVVAPPNASRHRQLLRWQVAISAGFFIIATLSVRSLVTDARHDPGIDMDDMAVAVVSFYSQGWDETRARRAVERIVEQGRSSAEAEAVAVSTGLPFGVTITPSADMSTPDTPIVPRGQYESAMLMSVTPDYFRAVGTPLLRGRAIDDRDTAGSPPVIVLSQSAALRLFGTIDAVDRELVIRVDTRGLRTSEVPRTATVVGVSADTDTTSYGSRRSHTAYVPFAQEYLPMVTVVARSAAGASPVQVLQQVIRAADPDIGIERIASAHVVLAGPFAYLRAAGITSVSLGGLTLILAMVGLYGVQSHGVAHRTREIGVRMSLGATSRQVRTMILKDGYTPVLQGLAIGLFIGIAGRAIVRAAIGEQLDILDPWMFLIVPIPLLLAAFCACYLPARRASRVDPSIALRDL